MAASKQATKAQRAKAVAEAIEYMRGRRTSSAKVARDLVTDEHLASIAAGQSPITPGMSPELAATLADTERRAAKGASPAQWGDLPTVAAYEAKAHLATVPGAGRQVGARADEATMQAHIRGWVQSVGYRAPSKASRDYQGKYKGAGCWPVYRELWGQYDPASDTFGGPVVGDPIERAKGVAMRSKGATYADDSFVTSFADWLAQHSADESSPHHAVALAAVQARGAVAVEPAPEPEPEPVKPKAPAKRPTRAKAGTAKRDTRKATK